MKSYPNDQSALKNNAQTTVEGSIPENANGNYRRVRATQVGPSNSKLSIGKGIFIRNFSEEIAKQNVCAVIFTSTYLTSLSLPFNRKISE